MERLRSQDGFTLIELLVVILIIGVLSGIAITVFVSQKDKASDAEAKSNARNLVSLVELCFSTDEDFRQCDTSAKLGDDFGLRWGSNGGEVRVVNATKDSFVATAVSQSDDREYTVTRHPSGQRDLTCTPSGGGCKSGEW
jgi:type IV pilus assembly protein PilA